MKINVTGRGVIPGIGALAPQINREVDIETLRKIITCRRFVVYDTESGIKITTGNFKNFFYKYQSVESVVEADVVENDTPTVDSFVETASNEIVESIVNDKPALEETTDDTTDVIIAESEEITTVSDETVEIPDDVDAVEVTVDTNIDSEEEVNDDNAPVADVDVEETVKFTSNKKRKKKH